MTPEQKAATAKGGKEFVAHLEEGEGFDPEFQSVNEALMPEDTVVTTTHAEHLVLETSEELVDTRQRLERRAFGDREAKRMPDEVPTIVSERLPSIVSERPSIVSERPRRSGVWSNNRSVFRRFQQQLPKMNR